MGTADARPIVCPSCGKENLGGSGRCFLCGAALAGWDTPDGNPWAAPASPPEPSPRTFTLGSLMLVIALIAVCLGVLVEVPGLGVLLLLVATPALVRTLAAASRRKAAGEPLAWWEKLVVFAGSVGVVSLIGLGSLVAFMMTCVPVGFVALSANSESGLYVGLFFGIVAAGAAGYFLIRRLWPRRAR